MARCWNPYASANCFELSTLRRVAGYQACDAAHAACVRSARRTAPYRMRIDLDAALWTIPTHKTKMRKDYLVRLSRQAIAILIETQALICLKGYLFPSS